jgi:hypothetical protein
MVSEERIGKHVEGRDTTYTWYHPSICTERLRKSKKPISIDNLTRYEPGASQI